MKKTALLILAIGISTIALAQPPQKKLPPKVKIELSDIEVSALYAKIDSLQSLLVAKSSLPSEWIQAFNQRTNMALQSISRQVQAQLVTDTVKAIAKTGKP